MAHCKDFMYDTELDSKGRKFQLSQMNLSFLRNQDFSVYLPNTGICENSKIHLAVESVAFLKSDASITTC